MRAFTDHPGDHFRRCIVLGNKSVSAFFMKDESAEGLLAAANMSSSLISSRRTKLSTPVYQFRQANKPAA